MIRAAISALIILCALGSSAAAQDAASTQPRSYRVVVDNDKVRELEFISRPGMGVCGTGRHSHPEHITVLLTPAKVKVTQNGVTKMMSMKAGDSFWEPAVTHEVENYSGAEVRSLIIEVKTPTGKAP